MSDDLTREQVEQGLFDEIKHGDEKHREWLLNAIRESSTLAALFKELEQQLAAVTAELEAEQMQDGCKRHREALAAVTQERDHLRERLNELLAHIERHP